jgi:ABC-type uncharacterized transport system auxiliary subunit
MSARAPLAALALAALCACPEAPARHYYTLTFPPGPPRFEAPFPYTVRVKDFAVNATYDGDQLVYREDVNEVEYAGERRWTERPQRMVADLARKYLRQSGLVEQVTEKLGEKPPDFVLEGDLDAIEQLDSGEDSYAHLSASLRLVRFESDQVVWRRSFDERRKVPGKSGRAVVRALSEILEQELSRSVDELSRALKGGGVPTRTVEPAAGEPATPPASPAPVEPKVDRPAEPPKDDKPKASEPQGLLRPDPASAQAQQQLLADETPMPAGKGAVFFPALSNDPEREPPLALYKADGSELVAQGRMGRRLVADPGVYEARFGSGAGRQQISVPVEVVEGRVTASGPTWSALELRVVNDHFIAFRGAYEIISMPLREEYGIGFGVDEEQGEEVKVWVLPPGLYKVVQAGGTYRDRTNFATVYLEPGKLTHFTLVKDQDTNDFKGAGVFTEEEANGSVAGPWKRSFVVGGDFKVGYGNDAGTAGWNADLGVFADVLVRYLKEPHLWVTRLDLEEGVLKPASTTRLEPYFDRLYFHSIYTYHLLSWLGPYIHAGLETKVLPRWQDYSDDRDIDEVDQNDKYLQTLHGDHFQLGNPFAPMQLKQGAGGNVRAVHTLWLDLDVRAGLGAQQYVPFGELAVATDPFTKIDRLKHVAGYNLEGVEGAIVATLRISRWFILNTELDGLLPFDDAGKTVFTSRTQASLRLVSFASLNYLLNVTRDPNRGAGLPTVVWEQLLQLRFSYSVL